MINGQRRRSRSSLTAARTRALALFTSFAFCASVPVLGQCTPATCVTIGTGCGGLTLTCNSTPVVGTSFGFTLSGAPVGAIGAVLAKFGPPLPGIPQSTPPFAGGCEAYLGAGPSFSLGLTFLTTQHYSMGIPNSTGYLGLRLSLQGAAISPSPSSVITLSNALEATIGDC